MRGGGRNLLYGACGTQSLYLGDRSLPAGFLVRTSERRNKMMLAMNDPEREGPRRSCVSC